MLLKQQHECDANGVQLKVHLNKRFASSNRGYADMISSSLTVNMGQVKAGCLSVTLIERIFQKRACVLPPSPSRWLLPSHHPSEGECHAVRCERACDTADLGRPDTVSVNPVNSQQRRRLPPLPFV